jgi:hypothetical protein
LITTPFSPCSQRSCITTASAPAGTGAPVKMRAAVPGCSVEPTVPAGIRWLTGSVKHRHRDIGGTHGVTVHCRVVERRHCYGRLLGDGQNATGRSRQRQRTHFFDGLRSGEQFFQGLFKTQHGRACNWRVFITKSAMALMSFSGSLGKVVAISASVAGHGDNIRAIGPQRRLAVFRTVDFQLGNRFLLEAFDQHQIAGERWASSSSSVTSAGFAPLMHQGPAVVTGKQHFARPGFAVAVGILARPVDIETVVGMLDHRDS